MKRFYKFNNYKDISQNFKNLLYKLGWRRINGTAKPEYIDLINGRLAYVTAKGELKERKPGYDKSGYATTKLKLRDGRYKSYKVHCLIKDYIPNPEKKPIGHHKDHDRKNNSIFNIEHATAKENANK